jgi:hypothetical protein
VFQLTPRVQRCVNPPQRLVWFVPADETVTDASANSTRWIGRLTWRRSAPDAADTFKAFA